MTLKQLRNASVAISVTAILLVGALLLWAASAASRAVEVNRAAEGLRRSIQELNYLTIDTILHHEDRSQAQWKEKHANLTAQLGAIRLQPEYESIVEVTRRNLAGANILYPQLIAQQNQALRGGTLDQSKFQALQARIVSRLLGQFQDMDAASARLGALSLQRLVDAQRLLGLMVLCFTIVVSTVVLGNWALISRNVINRVSHLKRATNIIAKGDLSYRTGLGAADEIGELANAFDAMAERVQQMLVQLKNEVQERIAAEQELRESREQIRAVTQTASDAIVSMDAQGILVDVNASAEKLFGQGACDLVGRQFTQFIHTKDRELVHLVRKQALSGNPREAANPSFELCVLGKNDVPVPVEVSAAAWDKGKGKFLTAIIRNIAARKNAEDQLRKSNEELEAFSYSVSHDLRAPLRHIDGFVALLKEECGDEVSETCRSYLAFISESATHMGSLIDNLLEFSRVGRTSLQPSTFSMGEVVSEALAENRNEERGRRIEYRIHPLPSVSGDRALFRQVWVNLISNAVKYTRPREHAIIEIGHLRHRTEEEFFIRDNGVGFDMKYVAKLFGVFHRLHRPEEFEGTGVGLANVQRIVQRHAGRVWAEGRIDEGACFHFALPVSEAT